MANRIVTRPIPGPKAFRSTGDAAVKSQAAILLLLGTQLRGDDAALEARAKATGQRQAAGTLPDEDLESFPVPRLGPASERIEITRAESPLRTLSDSRVSRKEGAVSAGAVSPSTVRKVQSDLAEKLYDTPDPLTAAQLLEASLHHPDELVRVAAAAAYFNLAADPRRLLTVLTGGTTSKDELVREVAGTALARIAPEDRRLRALTRKAPRSGRRRRSHTSLMVHGTFASTGSWWQPGGDFHTYILSQVRPDLYAASDRFAWSGGWSDGARALGAAQLRTWVDARTLQGLNLFTHSHGGSIAMLASHNGLDIGTLVLLSCPVHVHKYMPDFGHVVKVVSIRVRLDLVILADGGGQRYNHPNIQEHVLPIWFDHFASHSPKVWRKHKVPLML
jgi:hypothetical protein